MRKPNRMRLSSYLSLAVLSCGKSQSPADERPLVVAARECQDADAASLQRVTSMLASSCTPDAIGDRFFIAVSASTTTSISSREGAEAAIICASASYGKPHPCRLSICPLFRCAGHP